jgi:hypothetical protein
MKNVSEKVVVKIETRILYSTTFFFENRAFNVIMWENMVERGRSRMTLWRMPIAFWIPRATHNTLRLCNTDFPLQQWLHERASVLCFHTFPILF